MITKPVPADQQWRLWPRIAVPYECRSCGTHYEPALNPEIEIKGRQFMREYTADEYGRSMLARTFGLPFRGSSFTHDRYNAFIFCRSEWCSRYFDYGLESTQRHPRTPRLTMRRKWLTPQKAANGVAYR